MGCRATGAIIASHLVDQFVSVTWRALYRASSLKYLWTGPQGAPGVRRVPRVVPSGLANNMFLLVSSADNLKVCIEQVSKFEEVGIRTSTLKSLRGNIGLLLACTFGFPRILSRHFVAQTLAVEVGDKSVWEFA